MILRLAPALAACLLLLALTLAPNGAVRSQGTYVGHALAMHGDVKYKADFRHFDYVNPAAPKGGEVKFYSIGTFDSFNPYILRGVPAGAVGSTQATLMVSSADEPFTEYCLICETIETPTDRSWVAFTLRREAKFNDGTPLNAEAMKYSLDRHREMKGSSRRSELDHVDAVEVVDPATVRLRLKAPFSPITAQRSLRATVSVRPAWTTRAP